MENCDFEIRNPKWSKYVFIGLAIFLILVFFAGFVLFFVGVFKDFWNEVAPLLIIPIIPSPIVILGLYVYKKESFSLKDGEFKYVKPFKKAQSVRVEEIEKVIIERNAFIKVYFIDKSGRIKMDFLDDGTSFRDTSFVNALIKLKIPTDWR